VVAILRLKRGVASRVAFDWHSPDLAIADELGDKTGVAQALNGLADLAIEMDQMPRALHLAGAAHAIRERVGGGAPPESMRARDPREYTADKLDPDEAETAWTQGLNMTYEEAMAEGARQA
jgi:hypothetical protein